MAHDTREQQTANSEQQWPKEGYAWAVLGILTLTFAVATLDRLVLSLLIEPIKHDLLLSDFQLSLLQGLSFVIFYVLMGIPAGYVADRFPRKYLIAVGATFWSIMTASCSLAGTFVQLFIARIGVGVGEGTLSPGAYSLIADYFKPARLARAFSIFQLGAYLGIGVAYIAGAAVLSALAHLSLRSIPIIGAMSLWQLTFLIVSAPGFLMALLMAFAVREPERKHAQHAVPSADGAKDVNFWAFLAQSFWLLFGTLGAAAMLGLVGYGVISWTPSFFVRQFHWRIADIGFAYGAIIFLVGGAGSLIGGVLADILSKRGESANLMWVSIVSIAATTGFCIAYPLSTTEQTALAALCGATFFMSLPSSVAPTFLQLVTPNRLRGRVAAIHVTLISLLGAAGGPMAVAAATDFVFHDPAKIRYAIAVVSAVGGPVSLALSILSYVQYRRFLRRG